MLALILFLFSSPYSFAESHSFYHCENGWVGAIGANKQARFAMDRSNFEPFEKSAGQQSASYFVPSEARDGMIAGANEVTIQWNQKPMLCRKVIPNSLLAASIAQAPSNYDESYLQPAGAYFSQFDPNLSDLFSRNGFSNLCAPAALAQLFANQQLNFPNMNWSENKGGAPSEAIRAIAETCGTKTGRGTEDFQIVNCVGKILRGAGFKSSKLDWIGASANSKKLSEGGQAIRRNIRVSDIRKYLSQGYAVMLVVGYLAENSNIHTFEIAGTHAVSLLGYNYNKDWHQKRIQLQILNPANFDALEAGYPLLDEVQMVGDKDEQIFYLSGPGFRIPQTFTIVNDLIAFLPSGN